MIELSRQSKRLSHLTLWVSFLLQTHAKRVSQHYMPKVVGNFLHVFQFHSSGNSILRELIEHHEQRSLERSRSHQSCKHISPEIVGLILYRTLWVFSGCSGFLPQGRLTGWVRINTVKKVNITIVVHIK
jgi:hypothetical protein